MSRKKFVYFKNITQEQKDECLNFFKSGKFLQELPALTNLPLTHCRKILYEAGLKNELKTISEARKRLSFSLEIQEKCIKLYQDGYSSQETADILLIPLHHCNKILAQNGIQKRTDRLDEEDKIMLFELYSSGSSLRELRRKTGFDRATIRKVLLSFGIDKKIIESKKPPLKPAPTEKRCTDCEKTKPIDQFSSRKRQSKQGIERICYEARCKICEKIKAEEYRKSPGRVKKHNEWCEKNKEHIKDRANKTERERMKDPAYKLRRRVSQAVRTAIKENGSKKNRKSILDYLPYTIAELIKHLESLWESWMNWDNYGKYNVKTWDDNNISTWTWNLDHIIPQSLLPYDSMSHPNFLKCWALENLRPLSAKINNLDGATKIRHKLYKEAI